MILAVDERKTIMGDYSTLEMLDMSIGGNTSARWLAILVNDVNKFSGTKNMDEQQAESLAYLLAQEYKDVKYSVIQLFFYKFKCGYFGKFWGKVDPMVITCALKDFVAECETKKQNYLNEEYAQRKKQEDARRELWLKIEARWWNCQKELAQSCDKDGINLFLSMELESYDAESSTLTFIVTSQGYEAVEGKYFGLFSKVMKKHFPGATVQYRIRKQHLDEVPDGSSEEKEECQRQREIQAGLEGAQKIFFNVHGLEKEQLEQLSYAFKLRYKHSPAEFIRLFSKKQ